MIRNQIMIITYEILSGGSELNALKITKYIQNNYFWISLGSKRSTKEFKNKNIKKFYFLNFNILKLLLSIKKIKDIIKKKNISTIYAIGLYPGFIASLVKIFCRVKIITTKRNEMSFFSRIKYFPALLFMNSMSDIIETNSLSIFNKFKNNKFLKKKVVFSNNIIEKKIYNGHKSSLFDKKTTKKIKIIGMALNIRPVKDPLLIKKIIDITLKEKLFKFLVVGRDKDKFWKKIVKKQSKRNRFRPVFKCEKCGHEFENVFKLNRHLNRKTSCEPVIVENIDLDDPLVCKYCGRKYKYENTLNRHIQNSCKVFKNPNIKKQYIQKKKKEEEQKKDKYIKKLESEIKQLKKIDE